jgi:hypothetical protein
MSVRCPTAGWRGSKYISVLSPLQAGGPGTGVLVGVGGGL